MRAAGRALMSALRLRPWRPRLNGMLSSDIGFVADYARVLVTTTLVTFVIHMIRHNRARSNQPVTVNYATPVKMEDGLGHQQPVPVYVQNGQYVAA
jgi:hypothetical protein